MSFGIWDAFISLFNVFFFALIDKVIHNISFLIGMTIYFTF